MLKERQKVGPVPFFKKILYKQELFICYETPEKKVTREVNMWPLKIVLFSLFFTSIYQESSSFPTKSLRAKSLLWAFWKSAWQKARLLCAAGSSLETLTPGAKISIAEISHQLAKKFHSLKLHHRYTRNQLQKMYSFSDTMEVSSCNSMANLYCNQKLQLV